MKEKKTTGLKWSHDLQAELESKAFGEFES